MHQSSPYRMELKHVLTIAWPLLIAQLTQIGMGVADTIMAGHYSALDMAGVAVGFSVISPMMFFIQGVALGLIPVVSRLWGKQENSNIAMQSRHMMYILISISILFLNVYWLVDPILSWFAVPSDLQSITHDYIVYMLFSLPGFAIYQAVRQTCEGVSSTRPTMLIMFIGLLVNIPANAIFIYGMFGLPAFGGAGCGLATMIVYIVMAMATIIYSKISPLMGPLKLYSQPFTLDIAIFKDLLKIGVPIALTFLTEVTLFAAVAILLAPLGYLQVAAHQVAINFSSIVFMLPLSIAMAVAIRVSYLLGKGDTQTTIITIRVSRWFTILCATVTASLTMLFATWIISIYTKDIAVTDYAIPILFLAALFQISDAVQVISANALRGYKDTSWMLGLCIISYWVIGLPLGIVLGLTDWFVPAMAAQGLWIGIIVGLSIAAILLHIRMKYFQLHYMQ